MSLELFPDGEEAGTASEKEGAPAPEPAKKFSKGSETELTLDNDKIDDRCKKSVRSLFMDPSDSNDFLPGPDPDPAIQRSLMKHITQLICDQTGFIIEEKLKGILAPLIEAERTLIHVDAVLQALGINNIEEMQVLARYMLRRCTAVKGIMSKVN